MRKKSYAIVLVLLLVLAFSSAVNAKELTVHYNRTAGDYTGWTFWIWPDKADGQAYELTGKDDFGTFATVTLPENCVKAGIIVRFGNWEKKDVDSDRFIAVESAKTEVWLVQGNANIFTTKPDAKALQAANTAATAQPATNNTTTSGTATSSTSTAKAPAAGNSIAKSEVAEQTAKSIAVKAVENGKYEVTFKYTNSSANQVYLPGSFNNWSTTANQMLDANGDGIWEATLLLAKGDYEYKFLVDSKWIADPDNPEVIGEYGNSALHVGKTRTVASMFLTGSLVSKVESLNLEKNNTSIDFHNDLNLNVKGQVGDWLELNVNNLKFYTGLTSLEKGGLPVVEYVTLDQIAIAPESNFNGNVVFKGKVLGVNLKSNFRFNQADSENSWDYLKIIDAMTGTDQRKSLNPNYINKKQIRGVRLDADYQGYKGRLVINEYVADYTDAEAAVDRYLVYGDAQKTFSKLNLTTGVAGTFNKWGTTTLSQMANLSVYGQYQPVRFITVKGQVGATLKQVGESAEMTVILPEYIQKLYPELEAVYIAGDFNGWAALQDKYKMTYVNGKWSITETMAPGSEFKYILVPGLKDANDPAKLRVFWAGDKPKVDNGGNFVIKVNKADPSFTLTLDKKLYAEYFDGKPVYAVGSFNSWQPADPDFLMEEQPNGDYSITIPTNLVSDVDGLVEYKLVSDKNWVTQMGNFDGTGNAILNPDWAVGQVKSKPVTKVYYLAEANFNKSGLNVTLGTKAAQDGTSLEFTDNVSTNYRDYYLNAAYDVKVPFNFIKGLKTTLNAKYSTPWNSEYFTYKVYNELVQPGFHWNNPLPGVKYLKANFLYDLANNDANNNDNPERKEIYAETELGGKIALLDYIKGNTYVSLTENKKGVKSWGEVQIHNLPLIGQFVKDAKVGVDYNTVDDNDWNLKAYTGTHVTPLKGFTLNIFGETQKIKPNKRGTVDAPNLKYLANNRWIDYYTFAGLEATYALPFGINAKGLVKLDLNRLGLAKFENDHIFVELSKQLDSKTTIRTIFNKKDQSNGEMVRLELVRNF